MTVPSRKWKAAGRRRRRQALGLLVVVTGCLLLFVLVRLSNAGNDVWMLLTSNDVTVSSPSTPLQPPTLSHNNRIVYIGKFGLGHRLSKMAAAYHLGHRLEEETHSVIDLQVDWGTCELDSNGIGGPIFEYLFGLNVLPIKIDEQRSLSATSSNIITAHHSSTTTTNVTKQLIVKNDCHGYYAGQNYKNARQGIPVSYTRQDMPFFRKLDTDHEMFEMLRDKFQFTTELEAFRQQYQFDQSFVVGIHVRAGNGEQDHFVQAQRGTTVDLHVFLWNLVQLLHRGWTKLARSDKPSLIFLATDTPSIIPILQQQMQQAWNNRTIPIPLLVTYPQHQLPSQGGVTYSQVKVGQACLDAWKAMMVDTILLGRSNLLIAAMRSSFTQIMPLSMVFHHDHRNDGGGGGGGDEDDKVQKFCEVSESGRSMTCLRKREAWLFRKPSTEWTFSLDDDENGGSNGTIATSHRVVHKIMVHFPDVDEADVKFSNDWNQTKSFFSKSTTTTTAQQLASSDDKNTMVWGNGKTINQKYRKRGQGFTTEWTMLSEKKP